MNKRYTLEQDEFIRQHYSSAKECAKRFNEYFGTNLSYHAIKSHAQNGLKLRTDYRVWTAEMNRAIEGLLKEHTFREATDLLNKCFGMALDVKRVQNHCKKFGIGRGTQKPWTPEMNRVIEELIKEYPYAKATKLFNIRFNRNLSVKSIQRYCCENKMKRGFYEQRKEIDSIIKDNIDKPYIKIRSIISDKLNVQYKNESTVCVRANKMGLHRQHRVWHTSDKRFINGKQVSFSEYVRFIGNRWHRIPKELHDTALLIVKLQSIAKDKINGKDVLMNDNSRL